MSPRKRQAAQAEESNPTNFAANVNSAVADPDSQVNPEVDAAQNGNGQPKREYAPYREFVTTQHFTLGEDRSESPWLRVLRFNDKPPREITSKLREAGMDWDNPIRGAWSINANEQGRLATDRIVRDLKQHFGIGEEQGMSR